MGGHKSIAERGSHGLCQSVPTKNAGCHLSTCRKLLPKISISADFVGTSYSTHHSTPLLYIIEGVNSNLKISY